MCECRPCVDTLSVTSARATGPSPRDAAARAQLAHPSRRAPGRQGMRSWKEPLRPSESAPRHSAPPEERGGRAGRGRLEPRQRHVLACSSSRERAAGPRLELERWARSTRLRLDQSVGSAVGADLPCELLERCRGSGYLVPMSASERARSRATRKSLQTSLPVGLKLVSKPPLPQPSA